MASVKSLKAQAREYFYAENYVDLEDVMTSLELKSPKQAASLRGEFEDLIHERSLVDEVGELIVW